MAFRTDKDGANLALGQVGNGMAPTECCSRIRRQAQVGVLTDVFRQILAGEDFQRLVHSLRQPLTRCAGWLDPEITGERTPRFSALAGRLSTGLALSGHPRL